jgi:FkbM family methyltransferase
VHKAPEGGEHRPKGGYWSKRSNMMYYRYVDFLVRALAADARSLIDVGSANAQYIENFDWIPKRHTLDIKKPYSSENVTGIQTDFFDFQPEEKYDFATCLQVLEHIPDAKSFARKLFEVADRVLISVPYKWEKDSTRWHVHDPVDASKLLDWTGREPSYSIVVEEPLLRSPKRHRLICYYHPEGEKLDVARVRANAGTVPAQEGRSSVGSSFRLFGSKVDPGTYLIAAATEGARLHFGQSAEDVILNKLFAGKTEGFYVDVGAFHPRKYSNTYALHHFFGWRGVNIDASADAIALFEQERPDDINVRAVVGASAGEAVYWKFDRPSRNTVSEDNVQRQLRRNDTSITGKEVVHTRPLADILAEHVAEDTVIDLLNIDVEGLDFKALVSNDWEKYRPRVITIEDYAVKTLGLENSEIHGFLSEKGYRFASHAFDTSIYAEEDLLDQNGTTDEASSGAKRTARSLSNASLSEVPGTYGRAEALAKSNPGSCSLSEENKILRKQLREQLRASESLAKLLEKELEAKRKRNDILAEKLDKRDSELDEAREKRKETIRERNRFRRLYIEVEQSRFWSLTRSLREIASVVRPRMRRGPSSGPGA